MGKEARVGLEIEGAAGGDHRWVVMVKSPGRRWRPMLFFTTQKEAVACAASEAACGNQAAVQEREGSPRGTIKGRMLRVNARGDCEG